MFAAFSKRLARLTEQSSQVDRSHRSSLCQILGISIILLAVSLAGSQATNSAEPAKELLGLPLVYQDDFETERMDQYEFADANAWKWATVGDRKVLSQFQQSKVETPVRSPFNRGLVKGLVVGDVVIDIELQSTIKDYDHRDMCLFFGFQDPAHMYYVHLGKKADDHANQIFIVNGAPRKKISSESTKGTAWTDGWHHARVVRRVESGEISVFFDDMEKPVMKAVDKTFQWGQVGFGTFDDTGHFDNLAVYGSKTEPKRSKDIAP